MTKVKLKDATKELATGAGAVLSDATACASQPMP